MCPCPAPWPGSSTASIGRVPRQHCSAQVAGDFQASLHRRRRGGRARSPGKRRDEVSQSPCDLHRVAMIGHPGEASPGSRDARDTRPDLALQANASFGAYPHEHPTGSAIVGQRRTAPDTPGRMAVTEAVSSDFEPQPEAVNTISDLGQQLRRLRVWMGRPSLRTLEDEAKKIRNGEGTSLALPRSTAADAERGRHLPRLDSVEAFVRACGVSN
ncbi:MAG: Flagellar motor switch protein, partial [Dactylosporangium sp.]|nr:Flagellar motor switch protein [Dactylosporangium sp.]